MSLATFSVFTMTLGLIVRERGRQMATGTRYGTIASFEATRAIEAGGLLSILTAPWLVMAAIWISRAH